MHFSQLGPTALIKLMAFSTLAYETLVLCNPKKFNHSKRSLLDKTDGEVNEIKPQFSWELNPGVISQRLEKEGTRKAMGVKFLRKLSARSLWIL